MGQDGRLREVKVNPIAEQDAAKSDEGEKDFKSDNNVKLGTGPKSVKSGFSTATTEVAFSNYAYPKADDQIEGARLLKIRGKPGISKKNLIVIPLITTFLMFSGVDVL